jgi:aldehyde:ferredoxin oxidoreductase
MRTNKSAEKESCGRVEKTPDEIEVLKFIFETILKTAKAPTKAPTLVEMQSALKKSEDHIVQTLKELENKDPLLRRRGALVYFSHWRVLENCLLMCHFCGWVVTGWNTSIWDLMKIGERVTTMARSFNIREGFTKSDDWLPERFFYPHTSGALSKTSVDPVKLKNARNLYYEMMGWNENGVPSNAKLEELDIGWIASVMDKKG